MGGGTARESNRRCNHRESRSVAEITGGGAQKGYVVVPFSSGVGPLDTSGDSSTPAIY